MVFLLERAKLVVEGAGAVGVAALLAGHVDAERRRHHGVVLSGGNVDAGLLARSLAATRARPAGGCAAGAAARPPRVAGPAAGARRRAGRQPARRRAHPRGLRPARARDRGAAGARDARPRATPTSHARGARGRLRASRARAAGERAAPPSTSAAITRLRSSASGCHWTPSTNRCPVASIASGSSSSVEWPVTSRPVADRGDPLMVVGLGGVQVARRRPARPATRLCSATSWSAPSKLPGTRRCSSWPKHVGQVLDQRAAERDVEHLHPAADPEHRHVALHRAARERDLELVALRDDAVRLRVRARRRTAPDRRRRRRRGSARRSGRAASSGSSINAGSGGIISASPPARWIGSMYPSGAAPRAGSRRPSSRRLSGGRCRSRDGHRSWPFVRLAAGGRGAGRAGPCRWRSWAARRRSRRSAGTCTARSRA